MERLWDTSAETVREVLTHRAAGVAIATSRLGDELFGLTVSAWCSVALTPPLALACVEQVTDSHRAIAESGVFAISILRREQEFLSDRFAARAVPVDTAFTGIPYSTAATGAPLLDDCIGWLDCRVVAMHPGGTHSIVVGQVVAAAEAADAELMTPLIYLRRRYVGPDAE